MRTTPIRVVLALLALFSVGAGSASAQTRTLTIHRVASGAGGNVRVVSAAGTPILSCDILITSCVALVTQGAIVEIAADYPGRLSAGTGPASACALSTCAVTMSADADVTVTFTAGDGPSATVTTTVGINGPGDATVWADGVPCSEVNKYSVGSIESTICTVTYLVGSSVHFATTAGTAHFIGYSSRTGGASACGAAAACTFTLNTDASATATFLALADVRLNWDSGIALPGGAPVQFTLTVTYAGGGATSVNPAGPGAWTAAPPLPVATERLAAVGLDGFLYAMGGDTISVSGSSTNAMSVFNPGSIFDTFGWGWTNAAPMLARRQEFAATTAGGRIYAMGGASFASASDPGTLLALMEAYDPVTGAWTPRASMPAARRGFVAGTINGIIYAAGGSGSAGTPLGTLEAYDPSSDTWSARAPMPTPRTGVAGGVIDGRLYVAGGSNGTSPLTTLEVYDPATNTWTAKAPMPTPIAGSQAAVADRVLYVMSELQVYAYDPDTNAWSVKTPMGTPRARLAAASVNGVIYAVGGWKYSPGCCNKTSAVLEAFRDSLRWSSSDPSVARVDNAGLVTPVAPGDTSIFVNIGIYTNFLYAPFTVIGPSQLSIDVPVNNTTTSGPLTVAGWAINRGATSGTGVDAVHVYAVPAAGTAIFLGAASYGEARPDVGASFGSQFTNSGYSLVVPLDAGRYTILVYAHNAITGQFDAVASAAVTVSASATSPAIAVDTPVAGQTVTSAFEVGGWALDAGASTGTGVDGVRFYVQAAGSPAPGVFVGAGSYGASRGDVAALYGARFVSVGFHFTITGLGPGSYTLNVLAHSTVTNSNSIVKSVPFTVNATALMSIDAPSPEAIVTASTFAVAGWSIDRSIESTALSGVGVDALHIYAYPNPGSGQPPIFLGVAAQGISRSDVAAAYGSRYNNSGYQLLVDRVARGRAPGRYSIAVASRSSVSGTFNNIAAVWVTLQ